MGTSASIHSAPPASIIAHSATINGLKLAWSCGLCVFDIGWLETTWNDVRHYRRWPWLARREQRNYDWARNQQAGDLVRSDIVRIHDQVVQAGQILRESIAHDAAVTSSGH
jgi:hypothetical protein